MARLRLALIGSLLACVTLASACSPSSTDANGSGARKPTTGTAGNSSGGTSSNAAGTASDSAATGGTPNSTGGTSSNPATGGTSSSAAGAPSDSAPYANVTAVAVSGSDGNYTFNVTIESADIDCSQFADWWEVLGEDGSLIYRRILEHSHTDANGTSDPDAPGNTFTRSGSPVPVAAADVVIVRAHMSVGGYNGQVMRGSASDGFDAAADITANFAADVERADPQPTGCEF